MNATNYEHAFQYVHLVKTDESQQKDPHSSYMEFS